MPKIQNFEKKFHFWPGCQNNPNTKNIKVSGLGLRLNESSELQATLGIVLIVKVSEKSFMDH